MGRVRPARSLIDFGMYHSCFPQLIAGPIVRYEEIEAEVYARRATLDDFSNGCVQFILGLAKKVILADSLGVAADRAFGLPSAALDLPTAWIGILAYTLQIYFDFSGYSDMAIGLGRMIGFHYPENFNQPYRAASVTEFWRRWHMTLSRWFKDYLYIPLGGNRKGELRTLFNLVMVFFLCGLWHGASYTFVIWGLFHGALLIVERMGRHFFDVRVPKILGWLWTMITVMVGWAFFRASTLSAGFGYIGAMFDLHRLVPGDDFLTIVTNDKVTYMVLGVALALVPFHLLVDFKDHRYSFGLALSFMSLCVGVLGIVMMSVDGFNPFIYFRF